MVDSTACSRWSQLAARCRSHHTSGVPTPAMAHRASSSPHGMPVQYWARAALEAATAVTTTSRTDCWCGVLHRTPLFCITIVPLHYIAIIPALSRFWESS